MATGPGWRAGGCRKLCWAVPTQDGQAGTGVWLCHTGAAGRDIPAVTRVGGGTPGSCQASLSPQQGLAWAQGLRGQRLLLPPTACAAAEPGSLPRTPSTQGTPETHREPLEHPHPPGHLWDRSSRGEPDPQQWEWELLPKPCSLGHTTSRASLSSPRTISPAPWQLPDIHSHPVKLFTARGCSCTPSSPSSPTQNSSTHPLLAALQPHKPPSPPWPRAEPRMEPQNHLRAKNLRAATH